MQMLCNVYPNTVLFLREESSLVEQFVFEVLVVFVESLALAHFDEKSLGKKLSSFLCQGILFDGYDYHLGFCIIVYTGTVQQCCSSLDHLKRIIKHKADSLNKNSKRRIPRYTYICVLYYS